jgi:hypothetical protein
MDKFYSTFTDSQLRAAYRAIGQDRVKTGKNKGQITVRDLREEKRLVAEATRRGAEYPHNWLTSVE